MKRSNWLPRPRSPGRRRRAPHTIVERAQREADALKADADDYTIQVLVKLEEDLAKALSIVRNGLLKLNTEKAYLDQSGQSAGAGSSSRMS